jgi:tripartite motif-containing protein 33
MLCYTIKRGFYCFLISCGSSGRTAEKSAHSFKSDQVKVKQEPGTEEEICSFSGAVKQEKTEDGRRSACMVSSRQDLMGGQPIVSVRHIYLSLNSCV